MALRTCRRKDCSNTFDVDESNFNDAARVYCSRECRSKSNNTRNRVRLASYRRLQRRNTELLDDLQTLVEAVCDDEQAISVGKQMARKYADAFEALAQVRSRPQPLDDDTERMLDEAGVE